MVSEGYQTIPLSFLEVVQIQTQKRTIAPLDLDVAHVEESSCNFDNSDQNIQGMQAMNANLQPAKVKAKITKQLVPVA